ncbi:MAG: hypothetical protein NTY35_12855 [Planctomycetota bacterium]|nr:hypothetical protein [Planctomycetota bacterium]
MIQLVTAMLACGPWLCPSSDRDGAIALAREGRFAEALSAAEADRDPARRAEGLLYVRHHAGDLDGALRVAQEARRSGVGSAWLEEREAFIALTVRDAARTRTALSALDARADRGGTDIARAAEGYRTELAAIERTLAARDRGNSLAYAVVGGGALLLLAIFAGLALTGDRGRPSP